MRSAAKDPTSNRFGKRCTSKSRDSGLIRVGRWRGGYLSERQPEKKTRAQRKLVRIRGHVTRSPGSGAESQASVRSWSVRSIDGWYFRNAD